MRAAFIPSIQDRVLSRELRCGIERFEFASHGRLRGFVEQRGHFGLQRLGKTSEAADALDRAIGLAEDPAVRLFLLQRRG